PVMMNATNFVAAMPRLAASAATTAVTPPECPVPGARPRWPAASSGAGPEAGPGAGSGAGPEAGPGTPPGAAAPVPGGAAAGPPDAAVRPGGAAGPPGDAGDCPPGWSGGLCPESAVMSGSPRYAIRAFSSWIAAIGAGSMPIAIARYTEA